MRLQHNSFIISLEILLLGYVFAPVGRIREYRVMEVDCAPRRLLTQFSQGAFASRQGQARILMPRVAVCCLVVGQPSLCFAFLHNIDNVCDIFINTNLKRIYFSYLL